jgi:hypothetical protein
MRIRALAVLAFAACGTTENPCPTDAPNTICTIAGTGVSGYAGDNGLATEAVLYAPQDTAISPEGQVWVLDFNNYRIRAIDSAGMIHTVIGNGLLGDSPAPMAPPSPALDSFFNHTTDLFFHDGYLYLAAWHNSRLKRVRLSDMTLENFAGLGTRVLYAGDDGPAMMANLDLPSSIALSPAGDIVVMDQANQVIRSIDANGVIHRIAGSCVVEDAGPCANPSPCPNSNKMACGNPQVECFLACTPGYAGEGTNALDARMAQPYGQMADPAGRLAYNSRGDLIFADTDNNRVRMVSNGVITTIAGTGEAGYSGDDGPGSAAKINHPVDIAIAADGTVYFTDVQNNCVRKINPAGIISRVVGQCSAKASDRGFAGDGGSPLDAKLNRPYGIDLNGNKLYVSDSYNHRIRVVNL